MPAPGPPIGWPPPYPGYAVPPARQASHTGLIVTVVALVVVFVIVLGVLFVAVGLRGSGAPTGNGSTTPGVAVGPVTASTPLTAGRGHVVFSDGFGDPHTGWKSTPTTGATYNYANGAYTITGSGAFVYFASAPYTEPRQQLSVSITATLASDAPTDAGLGVGCGRGSGAAEIRYELIVFVDGSWVVERRNGAPSETTLPLVLKEGASATVPVSTPVTIVGVCATLSDGHTTRVALFINGTQGVDLTDTATTLTSTGWVGSILLAASDAKPTTLTVTRFEERDIAG
jgi:hypothetical protein